MPGRSSPKGCAQTLHALKDKLSRPRPLHLPLRLAPSNLFSEHSNSNITSSKHSRSISMSAVGALVFCTSCGNLLDSSPQPTLKCACCGLENNNPLKNVVTVTSTKKDPKGDR
ncbi:hypothetical protein BKA64DRAFT_257866 [Cadophora sp. MPI-SDFR-AT-0126]|nr:hypothetical protein BKA64DRAFT_257866 [Leotiomycetes sp. MPI-SDFR-AT-0126]